jgi:predicted amidophosphoribosyltransferase
MLAPVLDLLFPPQCAACNTIGSGLCEGCVPRDARRQQRSLPSLRVYALGEYRGALRRAVLALKDGRRDVAQTLGERLSASVSAGMLLVPVRTTVARRRARGIDGVEYVARVAAARSGAQMCDALQPLGSDAQRGRSRVERIAARGRFGCDPARVAGRHITLVDDVCTTGTTLEDCAGVLRASGAIVREALVIAVANEQP